MNIHLQRFLVGGGAIAVMTLLVVATGWVSDNSDRLGQITWVMRLSRAFRILVVIAVVGAISYLFGGLLLE